MSSSRFRSSKSRKGRGIGVDIASVPAISHALTRDIWPSSSSDFVAHRLAHESPHSFSKASTRGAIAGSPTRTSAVVAHCLAHGSSSLVALTSGPIAGSPITTRPTVAQNWISSSSSLRDSMKGLTARSSPISARATIASDRTSEN